MNRQQTFATSLRQDVSADLHIKVGVHRMRCEHIATILSVVTATWYELEAKLLVLPLRRSRWGRFRETRQTSEDAPCLSRSGRRQSRCQTGFLPLPGAFTSMGMRSGRTLLPIVPERAVQGNQCAKPDPDLVATAGEKSIRARTLRPPPVSSPRMQATHGNPGIVVGPDLAARRQLRGLPASHHGGLLYP